MQMRLKLLRGWRKDEDGATAVEFALLAVPFMLLVVGIIEMSLMFLAGSLLEGAVNDAARLIRTGQLQTMGGSSDDQKKAFLNAVCDHAGMLLDCSKFQYQVIKLDSFNDDIAPEFDDEGNLVDKDKFDLDEITSGCIAIVRVIYYYPLLTPLLSSAFSDSPNNTRLLMSTTAFETEPYQFGSAGC